MSAPTDSLVPALTESIAIVRDRDALREELRRTQNELRQRTTERDEARAALNVLLQHVGGSRSHELGLPLTWDEAVRNARAILMRKQP